MILELLGTRIIGPFYGTSLYVWSALIAVTLIALALGYYLGGYLADRYPGFRLVHVVVLGALGIALIPYISGSVLLATNPLGMRAGAFVAAFMLFMLPLTFMAMVGPLVIKALTSAVENVGIAVGSVYAISTAGSVVGTLALGFYLLPHFGTRVILLSLTFVLLGLAGLLLWFGRGPLVKWLPLTLLLVGMLAGYGFFGDFAHSAREASHFKVLDERESIYGWVRVVEDKNHGARLLLSDASVLSAMDVRRGATLLGYQVAMSALPQFRTGMKRALLIGLGGGHVARGLDEQRVQTDTIEIDPAVADAALQYFNFVPKGKFLVGDGRYEIRQLDKPYDLIIHDCFTGGSEPTHLLTIEMMRQLSGMLTDGGLLALNYVGYREGEGSEAVASVYATLRQVFPFIRVFVTDKGNFTDFIFLASGRSIGADTSVSNPALNWLLEREISNLPTAGAVVLTDDFNPLEHMQVRKAEEYRKIFMERIDLALLLR